MLSIPSLKLAQLLGAARFDFVKQTQKDYNIWRGGCHLSEQSQISMRAFGLKALSASARAAVVGPAETSSSSSAPKSKKSFSKTAEPVAKPKERQTRVRLKDFEKVKLRKVYDEWCIKQSLAYHTSLNTLSAISEEFDPARPLSSSKLSELVKLIAAQLPGRDAKVIIRNLHYYRLKKHVSALRFVHRDTTTSTTLQVQSQSVSSNLVSLLESQPSLTSLFTRLRILNLVVPYVNSIVTLLLLRTFFHYECNRVQ
jgi:hypothetical protein